MRLCLKRWAEGDFKTDPQLNLIPSLYQKLRSEGHDFSEPLQPVKKEAPLSKDPNVVSSQQEEDDIAKAIEMSLKEMKVSSPKTLAKSNSINNKYPTTSGGAASTTLYPLMNLNAGTVNNKPEPEPRKVRALYDFEAVEENELTFFAGQVLLVLDDSDANWWKGRNQQRGGEGLFPSNFVTADLSAEPEEIKIEKKKVQFTDDQSEVKEEPVYINEDTIDRLLHLLHEADPEDPSQDSNDMLRLEIQVNQMTPLVDNELERVDRKHAQLSQLSADLADAVSLYHQLMRDSGNFGAYGPPPPPQIPPHMMYSTGGHGANFSAISNLTTIPGAHTLPSTIPGRVGPQSMHSQIPDMYNPQQMYQMNPGMIGAGPLIHQHNYQIPQQNQPTQISGFQTAAVDPQTLSNGHSRIVSMNQNGLPPQNLGLGLPNNQSPLHQAQNQQQILGPNPNSWQAPTANVLPPNSSISYYQQFANNSQIQQGQIELNQAHLSQQTPPAQQNIPLYQEQR